MSTSEPLLSDPLIGPSQPAVTLPSPGLPTLTTPSRLALRKLLIPNFLGERCDWQRFWDQFQSSIHNNWIPKIDKFQYLLTYQAGAAKAAIQGIRLAEANYDVAIQILSDHFGHRDMLLDEHLDSLLSVAPVRSSTDVTVKKSL